MYCRKCGAEITGEEQICHICGEPIQLEKTVEVPEKPMRWYRFIIYVQLYMSALFSLFNAFSVLTGTVYGTGSGTEMLFRMHRGLRTVNYIVVILYLAAGIYCLYVRKQLADYKKKAPLLYLISLFMNIVPYVVFTIGGVLTQIFSLENARVDLQLLAYVVAAVLLVLANYVYFDKRKHLFIN